MEVRNTVALTKFSQEISFSTTPQERVMGAATGDEQVYERLTNYEEIKGRVKISELKKLRREDPMAHNACTIYGLFVQGCQLIIETDNKKYKEQLDAFYDGMNQPQYHGDVADKLAGYGRAPYEIVWNKVQSKPLFLAPIPVDQFDYWRDKEQQGKIEVDESGEPVAYAFKPSSELVMQEPQRLPELGDDRVKEDVVHLYQWNIQDGLWGMGVLEPTFLAFRRKRSMEVGISNNIQRHGWAKFVVSIGDKEHQPLTADITDAKSAYKRFNERSEIIKPYYHNVDELKPAPLVGANEALDRAIDQISSGTGVPKKQLLGTDSNTPLFSEHGGMMDAFYGKAKAIAAAIVAHDEDWLVPLVCNIMVGGKRWVPGMKKPKEFPRLKLEPIIGTSREDKVKEMELALKHHIRDREWVAEQMGWEGEVPKELNPAPSGSPIGLSIVNSEDVTSPKVAALSRTLANRMVEFPKEIIALQEKYGEELECLLGIATGKINKQLTNLKTLAEDIGDLRKGGSYIDLELSAFEKSADSLVKSYVKDGAVLSAVTIAHAYPKLSFNPDKVVTNNLLKFFEKEQLDLITGVTETIRNKMKERLGAGMIAGKSEVEIAKDLSLVSDKTFSRLRTIARTETKRVYDSISLSSFKEAGVEMVEWLSAGDSEVRGHHRLDGQRWPIDSPDIPRDILAEPNCRCQLLPILPGEELFG